jgi:pentose-5-phosphate-3-epimerase
MYDGFCKQSGDDPRCLAAQSKRESTTSYFACHLAVDSIHQYNGDTPCAGSTYICIYGVYTVFSAGKLPYIRHIRCTYTVLANPKEGPSCSGSHGSAYIPTVQWIRTC